MDTKDDSVTLKELCRSSIFYECGGSSFVSVPFLHPLQRSEDGIPSLLLGIQLFESPFLSQPFASCRALLVSGIHSVQSFES